jgi:hypothetical protein
MHSHLQTFYSLYSNSHLHTFISNSETEFDYKLAGGWVRNKKLGSPEMLSCTCLRECLISLAPGVSRQLRILCWTMLLNACLRKADLRDTEEKP